MPGRRSSNMRSSTRALRHVGRQSAMSSSPLYLCLTKKSTYINRLMASLFVMFNANDTDHMVLSVHNDVIPHIREQAVANGETLGMRMAVCTESAIDRLKNNNYVFYVLRRDEDVRIKLTESLQAIFKSLRTQFLASDQFASLTRLTSREHRMLCDTFSNLMKSKKMPIGKAFTRKQLAVALHMSECDRYAKDVRMQQCNGSPRCGSPITPTVVSAEIVDLMPLASTSHVPDVKNLRTPMRRSSTSNQLAVLAYPTPDSMPRRRGTSLCEAHSISLSGTPQSRRMSLPMDEAEDQIATSSTIPTPSLSLLDVLPISEFLNWTSTSVQCSLGLVGLSTSNSQWIVSLVEKAKAITEESQGYKAETVSLKSQLLRSIFRRGVSKAMWNRRHRRHFAGYRAAVKAIDAAQSAVRTRLFRMFHNNLQATGFIKPT